MYPYFINLQEVLEVALKLYKFSVQHRDCKASYNKV